jgi:hypothetical protein
MQSFPHARYEGVWVNRASAPLVLDFNIRWSDSHTCHLVSGKVHQYPLSRKLGGSQILSGRFGEEFSPLLLLAIELRCFVFHLVT